jgi:hypothetical protein
VSFGNAGVPGGLQAYSEYLLLVARGDDGGTPGPALLRIAAGQLSRAGLTAHPQMPPLGPRHFSVGPVRTPVPVLAREHALSPQYSSTLSTNGARPASGATSSMTRASKSAIEF